jgi:hypothetical protein
MNAGIQKKSIVKSLRNDPAPQLTNPQIPGALFPLLSSVFPRRLENPNFGNRVLLENLPSLTLTAQAGPGLELARSRRQSLESVDAA